MGKRLTDEEWRDIRPPFVWLKLRVNIDELQLQFIDKWMNEHLSGWWYRGAKDGDTILYVFQWSEDQVMFKIWSTNNTFKEDHGEIQ